MKHDKSITTYSKDNWQSGSKWGPGRSADAVHDSLDNPAGG